MPDIPDEVKEQIITLWSKGQNAETIRITLNLVSRNVVLGFIYRLRKKGDTRAKKRTYEHNRPINVNSNFNKTMQRKQNNDPPKPKSSKRGPSPFELAELKAIETRPDPRPARIIRPKQRDDGHCQSIYGHPSTDKDWGYCPEEKVLGTSWCVFHLRRYLPSVAIKYITIAKSRVKETA